MDINWEKKIENLGDLPLVHSMHFIKTDQISELHNHLQIEHNLHILICQRKIKNTILPSDTLYVIGVEKHER